MHYNSINSVSSIKRPNRNGSCLEIEKLHSGDLFSMGISIAKKSHFSEFQTSFAQTYTYEINSLSILEVRRTL